MCLHKFWVWDIVKQGNGIGSYAMFPTDAFSQGLKAIHLFAQMSDNSMISLGLLTRKERLAGFYEVW